MCFNTRGNLHLFKTKLFFWIAELPRTIFNSYKIFLPNAIVVESSNAVLKCFLSNGQILLTEAILSDICL